MTVEAAFEAWWSAKTYRETALRLVMRDAFLAGWVAKP